MSMVTEDFKDSVKYPSLGPISVDEIVRSLKTLHPLFFFEGERVGKISTSNVTIDQFIGRIKVGFSTIDINVHLH